MGLRRPSAATDGATGCSSWGTEGSALLLFEHQLPLLADHALRGMGKTREQPWQHDLDPHAGLVDVDEAGRHLAQSRSTERQPIAGPNVLIDRQKPGKFTLGAT